MVLFLFSSCLGLIAGWLFAVNAVQVYAISYLFFLFVEYMIESYKLADGWKDKLVYVVIYALRFAFFYLFIPLFMSHMLAVTVFEAVFIVTFIYIVGQQNNWE